MFYTEIYEKNHPKKYANPNFGYLIHMSANGVCINFPIFTFMNTYLVLN